MTPEKADSIHQPIVVRHERDRHRSTRESHLCIREDHYLLCVSLCRGRADITNGGKEVYAGKVWPGMMRLMSPGEELRSVVYTPSEAAILRIPGPRLRATVQALHPRHQPGEVGFINALCQPQVQVEQLGRLALHAQRYDPVHARLFVEGVADSLLACLLHHHAAAGMAPSGPRALAPGELRQAIDFAEARLEQTLGLEAWAGVLQMPAPEFTRRFRAATGTSPYGWFMQRRIDRAKELLRGTRKPLNEVALEVGFCSQSHFTDAFRRRTGVSPARWRRDQTV